MTDATLALMAPFEGFHYCGYGLDEHFASQLRDAGVVFSARAADAGPEALEPAASASVRLATGGDHRTSHKTRPVKGG